MSFDDDYIDYLAEHESGFCGSTPARVITDDDVLSEIADDGRLTVIGLGNALTRMAHEVGGTCRQLPQGGEMNNRKRRHAKKVRKAGGVRKAGKQ